MLITREELEKLPKSELVNLLLAKHQTVKTLVEERDANWNEVLRLRKLVFGEEARVEY